MAVWCACLGECRLTSYDPKHDMCRFTAESETSCTLAATTNSVTTSKKVILLSDCVRWAVRVRGAHTRRVNIYNVNKTEVIFAPLRARSGNYLTGGLPSQFAEPCTKASQEKKNRTQSRALAHTHHTLTHVTPNLMMTKIHARTWMIYGFPPPHHFSFCAHAKCCHQSILHICVSLNARVKMYTATLNTRVNVWVCVWRV